MNLSRWGAGEADNEKFRLLKRAILERQALRFDYASSYGSIRPRRVLPARLVFKGQGWYLQAFDEEREDYRTFRLSRILSPEPAGEVFHRRLEPPDVEFSGDIPPLFRVEAKLRFAPHMAYRVYDEFGQDCVAPQPDGSLLVEAVFPEDQWLYGYLLSFGVGVEVLAPDALRRRLAALGWEIYRAHAPEHDTPCQGCGAMMGSSTTKEVPTMEQYKDMKFCQSCGMPLLPGTELGTEADGSPSPDYCSYCYKGGKFKGEMTMEEMIVYGRSVARGCQNAFVVMDMPFMSYQVSPEQALTNAGRLMKETLADAVKLEGGKDVAEQIRAITAAGIPVCGHVGMMPQSHHAFGASI